MMPFSFTQQEMETTLISMGYGVYHFDYLDDDCRTGTSENIKLTLASKAFLRSELEELVSSKSKYELLERFGVCNVFYSRLKEVLLTCMIDNG